MSSALSICCHVGTDILFKELSSTQDQAWHMSAEAALSVPLSTRALLEAGVILSVPRHFLFLFCKSESISISGLVIASPCCSACLPCASYPRVNKTNESLPHKSAAMAALCFEEEMAVCGTKRMQNTPGAPLQHTQAGCSQAWHRVRAGDSESPLLPCLSS